MIGVMPRKDQPAFDDEKHIMMARRLREFAFDARQAAVTAEAIADGLEGTQPDDITGLLNAALDPRHLTANAVSVPSVAARKAVKAADTLAAMAASGASPLSIHETARLRGVAVNTLRKRLPFVTADQEPPVGGSDPF
jgi:hypothetical protein